MKPSPTREKSFRFAIKVVRLVRTMNEPAIRPLMSQLLRSATSVGANVEEAAAAQSRKDFLNKMSIASKEARESHYWVRILRDSKILAPDCAHDLLVDVDELVRLLTSIVRTTSQPQDASLAQFNSKLKTQNSKLAPTAPRSRA